MKSLLISSDRSGSGKTSITLGIAASLSKEYSVQPFKVAMDYIDPSYLSAVTGRLCRNLDGFVMTPDEIDAIWKNACIGADISVIEGVRGLYEGSEPLADAGSTAEIAKMLNQNVVLVVNARSITRSAAAIVKGFCGFDPDVKIRGVILNQVTSQNHFDKAKTAIEHYTDIEVLGAVKRTDEMNLEMRHLGLIPYQEGSRDTEFSAKIEKVSEIIEKSIDIDALLSIASETPSPSAEKPEIFRKKSDADVKIAIASDEAFTFCYADIFEILETYGAEIVMFSPIHDRLPDADGYIFGGGYPEYYAAELEKNDRMREAVKEVSDNGVPIYAECGGLMYLTERQVLKAGWNSHESDVSYDTCGIFKGYTSMPERRTIRYVCGECAGNPALGDHHFKGHEYHYSGVFLDRDTKYSYRLSRGRGIINGMDGAVVNNTTASYTHLHPVSSRGLFSDFIKKCRAEKLQ